MDPNLERNVCVDLESAINGDQEKSLNLGKPVLTNNVDDDSPLKYNDEMNTNSVMVIIDGGIKEKRKKCLSAKKPPKPPTGPHRGFSLDAADQKMIKELAELAMIKRARIERMKALMQKKTSKASSSSSSSTANLFAMVFTIIVFLVMLFQGMSCQISYGTFNGSPPTTQTNENALIFIQEGLNPSAHDSV
ncbi:uncharacterized protein [Rutidosis leptorrhynchoides]|uniref:uncharacterized protein n=1 Tax=Rutidosis leptorrhynchoides TaxID=125765 RepID=UPI003A999D46